MNSVQNGLGDRQIWLGESCSWATNDTLIEKLECVESSRQIENLGAKKNTNPSLRDCRVRLHPQPIFCNLPKVSTCTIGDEYYLDDPTVYGSSIAHLMVNEDGVATVSNVLSVRSSEKSQFPNWAKVVSDPGVVYTTNSKVPGSSEHYLDYIVGNDIQFRDQKVLLTESERIATLDLFVINENLRYKLSDQLILKSPNRNWFDAKLFPVRLSSIVDIDSRHGDVPQVTVVTPNSGSKTSAVRYNILVKLHPGPNQDLDIPLITDHISRHIFLMCIAREYDLGASFVGREAEGNLEAKKRIAQLIFKLTRLWDLQDFPYAGFSIVQSVDSRIGLQSKWNEHIRSLRWKSSLVW